MSRIFTVPVSARSDDDFRLSGAGAKTTPDTTDFDAARPAAGHWINTRCHASVPTSKQN
jgi:hypothetical protein